MNVLKQRSQKQHAYYCGCHYCNNFFPGPQPIANFGRYRPSLKYVKSLVYKNKISESDFFPHFIGLMEKLYVTYKHVTKRICKDKKIPIVEIIRFMALQHEDKEGYLQKIILELKQLERETRSD